MFLFRSHRGHTAVVAIAATILTVLPTTAWAKTADSVPVSNHYIDNLLAKTPTPVRARALDPARLDEFHIRTLGPIATDGTFKCHMVNLSGLRRFGDATPIYYGCGSSGVTVSRWAGAI